MPPLFVGARLAGEGEFKIAFAGKPAPTEFGLAKRGIALANICVRMETPEPSFAD